MYNTHETLTVEPEREYDEKRQDDDRKTKQKMELIRTKLKTHPKKVKYLKMILFYHLSLFFEKDILLPSRRPPSSSKQMKSNVIPHHRRNIHIETSSNLSTNGDNSSGTSSLEQQQYRPLSYSFSANLFNTYNLLSTTTKNDFLHEEDSEDDEDSHDEYDEQKSIPQQQQQQIFTSRSYSPSVFYHKKSHHHHQQHNTTKNLLSQETATTTTSINDTTSSAVLVDYVHRLSPTLPIVSTSSRILSATKCLNTSDQPINSDEKNERLYHHSCTSPMLELIDDDILSSTNQTQKQTSDIQSRNETSLSKPIWTDDDEQINVSDEYTPGERASTSQSILFRHQNSSTSTTAVTPIPTLPQVIKKSSLPSTNQQFYHHHKPINNDQQQIKSSPRSLMPLTLSKYRRIPSNVHLTNSTQQQTFMNSSNELPNNENNSTDSFNEHLMLNKRIEILKTPGKQQSPLPSPSSSLNTTFPPPPPSKRQDMKSVGRTTPSSSSILPMDSTKVTIGKLNNRKIFNSYFFLF
jgi:hypothetical protein